MKVWGLIISSVIFFGAVLPGWALVIEKPTEGQVIVVGEPFEVWVRTEPGEECDSVGPGLVFNEKTGKYEGTHTFMPDDQKQEREQGPVMIIGEGRRCRDAEVNLTVVLPPSTTVVSIGANFDGEKKTFLKVARKQNGDLVSLGFRGEDLLSVGAKYSDGVGRWITENPDVTYESLDEKVAIALPLGSYSDTLKDKTKDRALVKATGPGETKIIVRYQGHESSVTVHVRECPYIEGKTEKEGCP